MAKLQRQRGIPHPLTNDDPIMLQVNSRVNRALASSGHMMRFKQLFTSATA
ncbi:MAG: hypothetical protein IPK52_21095 [Chloroflexi bacterium]|nr:hypothetical protein [Chloroflexota bacterium]